MAVAACTFICIKREEIVRGIQKSWPIFSTLLEHSFLALKGDKAMEPVVEPSKLHENAGLTPDSDWTIREIVTEDSWRNA